ncbi:MAG TPA: MMPL family transporter [Actinomycetes bacterium]|nr:MMPL family transporter [Actinomycetes bacterium]
MARYHADPISAQARELVLDVRAVDPPAGSSVLVGGDTAELVDLLASLSRTLPWMAAFVGLVTFVLLFLAFGSVLLPLKAIVMNLLSLTASFGALVWIFQEGHLSGPLGFTPTGTVEATQPILMLAIAFGLSLDYEVLLLSRVREQWDRSADNTTAVTAGLQRTSRLTVLLHCRFPIGFLPPCSSRPAGCGACCHPRRPGVLGSQWARKRSTPSRLVLALR